MASVHTVIQSVTYYRKLTITQQNQEAREAEVNPITTEDLSDKAINRTLII